LSSFFWRYKCGGRRRHLELLDELVQEPVAVSLGAKVLVAHPLNLDVRRFAPEARDVLQGNFSWAEVII